MNSSQYGITLGLIISFMGGCATMTDDPTEGGLLGGFYGLGTGAYEERLDKGEAQLQEVRQLQQQAGQEQQRLVTLKAQKQRQKNELELEMVRLEQETHLLSKQVAQIKSNNTTINRKKAQITQRIQQVNANLAQLKQHALIKSAELETHQETAAQLDKEVKQLWEILHTLE